MAPRQERIGAWLVAEGNTLRRWAETWNVYVALVANPATAAGYNYELCSAAAYVGS